MTRGPLDGLLDGLLDDASQFPPGELPLDEALRQHLRWRAHPRRSMVGRFVVPAERLGALAAGLRRQAPGQGLDVAVIAGARVHPRDAVAALAGSGATVTAVEHPPGCAAGVDRAWRDAFPGAEAFIEASPRELASIAGRGGFAKVRCGGVAESAVPSPREVAAFIAGCVALGLPFKATAGLHAPLHRLDPVTGRRAHGFLNLWAAVAHALDGGQAADLERTLVAASVEELAFDDEAARSARRLFRGFGTCSIDEPMDGLRDLGLLDD